jgi:hypothetical protein
MTPIAKSLASFLLLLVVLDYSSIRLVLVVNLALVSRKAFHKVLTIASSCL